MEESVLKWKYTNLFYNIYNYFKIKTKTQICAKVEKFHKRIIMKEKLRKLSHYVTNNYSSDDIKKLNLRKPVWIS